MSHDKSDIVCPLNDIRVQFEAWAKSKGISLYQGLPVDQNDTGYGHVETQRLWEAWQAAVYATNCDNGDSADDYDSAFQETERAPYLVDAAGLYALQSFLTVAEEFRLSAQPFIEDINEGGKTGEDEISVVFDRQLNQAKGAISRSVVCATPPEDLGQFREAIVQAISNVSYMTGEGAAYTKLVELLALIDDQKD